MPITAISNVTCKRIWKKEDKIVNGETGLLIDDWLTFNVYELKNLSDDPSGEQNHLDPEIEAIMLQKAIRKRNMKGTLIKKRPSLLALEKKRKDSKEVMHCFFNLFPCQWAYIY